MSSCFCFDNPFHICNGILIEFGPMKVLLNLQLLKFCHWLDLFWFSLHTSMPKQPWPSQSLHRRSCVTFAGNCICAGTRCHFPTLSAKHMGLLITKFVSFPLCASAKELHRLEYFLVLHTFLPRDFCCTVLASLEQYFFVWHYSLNWPCTHSPQFVPTQYHLLMMHLFVSFAQILN